MTDTLNVVCPGCRAVNRVLSGRLADAPKCGKCGGVLLPAHPIELDTPSFDRFTAKTDLPVLVDFWAPWCGPCRAMGPAFEKASQDLYPHVLTAKVNTEASQALAARFGIRSIPTMALFRRGRELARVAGAMPPEQIVGWTRTKV